MDQRKCAACPLAGTGQVCPSWDWPAYCRHATREWNLHPDQRYWTGQILRQAGLTPPVPLPPGTLVIRGHGTATGYGRMARYLVLVLRALGLPVVFEPIDGPAASLDPYLSPYATGHGYGSGYGEPCLQMSSPWAVQHPGNILFSMFETSRLPSASVATYNAARAVVVPCRWNELIFRESGVTVPIRVVPLGIDPTVYRPSRSEPAGEFVVLSVAALSGGGHRKLIPDLVTAFLEALGGRPDARLVLKIAKDDTFDDPGHPRISVDRSEYDDAGMVQLYASSSVYATMSCGEGWGMPVHESLACGRPVIGPIHTGMAAYLTEDCCYPVAWDEEPATGPYYAGHGNWMVPSHDSMVRQLRAAYADPAGRARKGEAAARRAAEFSWRDSGEKLLAVLREFGLVDRPPSSPPISHTRRTSSLTPDPRLALIGACPHRGSILPLSEQPGGCGCGGRELSECRAGKGKVAGRVITEDCLLCVDSISIERESIS